MSDHSKKTAAEITLTEALARGFAEVIRCVRFSDVGEYLAELEKQRGQMSLPFVRATCSFRQDRQFPVIVHVALVSGFWGRQEYVELQKYCGDYMQGGEDKAHAKFVELVEQIQRFCDGAGIELRAGRWSVGGGGNPDA